MTTHDPSGEGGHGLWHEGQDVKTTYALAILGFAALLIVIAFLVSRHYIVSDQPPRRFRSTYQGLEDLGADLPPQPRLQPDPAREANDWRAAASRDLGEYGPSLGAPGRARIPITEAMARYVESAARAVPPPSGAPTSPGTGTKGAKP